MNDPFNDSVIICDAGFFSSGCCLIGNILVSALLLKYHTCKTKTSAKEQWGDFRISHHLLNLYFTW